MTKCIWVLSFIALMTRGLACDVCGVSTVEMGSFNLGYQQYHRVGLGFARQSFHITPPSFFSGMPERGYRQSLNRMEIQGAILPLKFLRLSASIPWVKNRQHDEKSAALAQGFGDVRSGLELLLFNAVDSGRFDHQLSVGGEIKFPTGNYGTSVLFTDNLFATETGAWDFRFKARYALSSALWAFVIKSFYEHNGVNANRYRVGNMASTRFLISRKFALTPSHHLWPFIGAQGDILGRDVPNISRPKRNPHSGGYVANIAIGANWSTENIMAGLDVSIPVAQNLAAGSMVAQPAASIQINYLIKKK